MPARRVPNGGFINTVSYRSAGYTWELCVNPADRDVWRRIHSEWREYMVLHTRFERCPTKIWANYMTLPRVSIMHSRMVDMT